MNYKIDQTLILKPIKHELAKNQQENPQEANQVPIPNGIQTEDDANSTCSLDSILEDKDHLLENSNQHEVYSLFQDQKAQQKFLYNQFPLMRNIQGNQNCAKKLNDQLFMEKEYNKMYEKYIIRLSKKDYVKHLLDPTFVERKRLDELRKQKEQQSQQEKSSNVKRRRTRKVDEKSQNKQKNLNNQILEKVKEESSNNEAQENQQPNSRADGDQLNQDGKQQEDIKSENQEIDIEQREENQQARKDSNQDEKLEDGTQNQEKDQQQDQQKNKRKRAVSKNKGKQQSDNEAKIEVEEDEQEENNEKVSNNNNNKEEQDQIKTENMDDDEEEQQRTLIQDMVMETPKKILKQESELSIKKEEQPLNSRDIESDRENDELKVKTENEVEDKEKLSQNNSQIDSKNMIIPLRKQKSKINGHSLTREQKIKIDEEEHQSRIKKLNEQQFMQFKIFSCMNLYKNIKNKLQYAFQDNYYQGADSLQQKMLLDRSHYTLSKKDPQALQNNGEAVSSYQKKKEYLDNGFELKIEREQKERKLKKHTEFMKILYQHHTQFFEFHKQVKKKMRKRCLLSKAVAENIVRKKNKEQDKRQQQSITDLWANNQEVYINMIKNTKSKRIQELLQQTDNFLRKLGGKVMIQKGQKINEQFDEEVVFGHQSDDYLQNFIQSNKVYFNLTHTIKEDIKEQPKLLKCGKLKNYQLIGLEWMVSLYNNKLNGILADEMGLGKTIQTISLFAFLVEVKKVFGCFLIVVPLSTLSNWCMEFDKWAPSLKYVVYKGSPAVRKDIAKWMRVGNWHVCITTYDYILKDKATLCKWNWKYIVIDEGHRMKNSRSKFAQILGQQYVSEYRILLTGTPLQNNLAELWALLNFLLPRVFESCEDFEKWFSIPLNKAQQNQEEAQLTEEEQMLIINRLHQVLRPFLLRRVKKEVESELPNKIEQVIKVDMSPWQKLYYEQLEQKQQICLDPNTGKVQFTMLNNLVMQLRKICNHPYLFLNDFMIDEDIWRVSGKMELLDRIMPKLLASKHRMLIFTQMTQVMDIMQFYFEMKGIKFLRLDGATKAEDRGESQRLFNQENSEYNVFILSTRAGGLGLNLQSADTVIIYDSDWNPQQDLQAQDRAHRIGSKSEVRVFRLVTARSIEEAILSKAKYKRGLDEMIIQAGMYNQKSSQDERTQKIEMILERNKDDQDESEYIPNDEQINELISRSEKEFEYFQQMDIERYEEEREIYPDFQYPTEIQGREEVQNKNWHNYRFMREQDIPDWIRAPRKQKNEQEIDVGRGNRQRKVINYNEEMSHVEFMRMIGEYKQKPSTSKDIDNFKHLNSYEQEEQELLDSQEKLQENDAEVMDLEEFMNLDEKQQAQLKDEYMPSPQLSTRRSKRRAAKKNSNRKPNSNTNVQSKSKIKKVKDATYSDDEMEQEEQEDKNLHNEDEIFIDDDDDGEDEGDDDLDFAIEE